MIGGNSYYFFRLERSENDSYPEYRIAESFDDLYLRFGEVYMSQFCDIIQLNEVTPNIPLLLIISFYNSFIKFFN